MYWIITAKDGRKSREGASSVSRGQRFTVLDWGRGAGRWERPHREGYVSLNMHTWVHPRWEVPDELVISWFLSFFFFFALPQGMWDLSSLTRDWTQVPCIGTVESLPLGCQGSPWWFLNMKFRYQMEPTAAWSVKMELHTYSLKAFKKYALQWLCYL